MDLQERHVLKSTERSKEKSRKPQKCCSGECVHNYLIKDAIFDNNVLGFHVEYIKTMEGDFDWDDPTLADAIDVNELYMSEERMSLIANHIIQNHKAKTRNRQYTAIFAVSSIEGAGQVLRYF